MYRHLLFSNKENSKSLFNKTSRFTKNMNSIAIKAFNNWGELTYEDILNNYPIEIINNCWNCLSRFIIDNYLGGKGTFIKGLGTFTSTNIEIDFDGTTNKKLCHTKKRFPVFLVSYEFIDYIKSGIFTEKSGLIQYKQKKIGYIPIVQVNYSKISYDVNISRDECFSIITSIINNMADEIKKGVFKEKEIGELGTFIIKENIFGMKFNKDIIDSFTLKTQKLNEIKKHIWLYMEPKDSEGVSYYNTSSINESEKEIKPNLSVIKTNQWNNFLRKTMNIDIKKLKNILREDIFLKKPENKPDYLNQKPYPIQDLYGLKIPKDILVGIYNNKNLLIEKMKEKDKHEEGLIPKLDFLTIFYNTNCHNELRIETIEKIINIYLNYDPEIILIKYIALINAICKDIKEIIDNKYHFLPIPKYKRFISPSTKRAINLNSFSRERRNLRYNAISSLDKYKLFPRIEEMDIKSIMYKVNDISSKLIKYSKKEISYLELQYILGKNSIHLSKIKTIQLLKLLDIKNPNVFNLDEFQERIKKYSNYYMNSRYNISKSLKNIEFFYPNLIPNKTMPNDNEINKENSRYYNNTISSVSFHNNQRPLFLRDKILSKSQDYKKNQYLTDNDNTKDENNQITKENKIKNLEIDKEDLNLSFKDINKKNDGYNDKIELVDEKKNTPNQITLSSTKNPNDIEAVNKFKNFLHLSKVDYKLEFRKFIDGSDYGLANLSQFKKMLKKLNLGLTNMEIEEIMLNFGLTSDGYINLIEFYKYITEDEDNLLTYDNNIIEFLKEIKKLLIKYYINPKLAFELNEIDNKEIIDFDKFKEIIIDLYKKEEDSYPIPPDYLLKSMYDYIDIEKDGIIDINEWNETFASFQDEVDLNGTNKSNCGNIRKFEIANNFSEIYQLIYKYNKIIKEKVRLNSVSKDSYIIKPNNLIKILKDTLPLVYLTQEQWRTIVSLGEGKIPSLVNYIAFFKNIKMNVKKSKSFII